MTFLINQTESGYEDGIGGDNGAKAQQSKCEHWSNADDESLMRGIAERHAAALEALYDRYSGRVHNLCRRVLDHDDSAEDAVIDTFWEIWQRPDRFDRARATVLTYLLMLARCRAIDRRRSIGSQHRLHQSFGDADPGEEAQPLGRVNARETAFSDDCNAASAVFCQLEPPCREAVRLCIVQGMTARQAATLLQQPLGTIKSRIRKGVIQMRELLRTQHGYSDAAQGTNLAD